MPPNKIPITHKRVYNAKKTTSRQPKKLSTFGNLRIWTNWRTRFQRNFCKNCQTGHNPVCSHICFKIKLEHVSLGCEDNLFAWWLERRSLYDPTQPSGFMEEGKEHKFCKLLKSLYGLKQAPRAWYEKNDFYFKV